MTYYEQRVSLLEFLYRKPGVRAPESAEVPEIPEGLIRAVFDDLQRSKMKLRERVATLQARNKELDAYAHVVAHDLKDPLTILITTADVINEIPDLTPRELKGYLEQLRSTAYEMDGIINNLLLFAEVSKAETPLGPVQMATVVANVQDRLSPMIKGSEAQLILPEVWPDAIGYGPWIEEVWANYLSNAIKHGGRPPRVELGASAQSDDTLRFWTRDNGPGIPPDTRRRLFTPFSQTGSVRSPGHGLGLSIVSQIVEKLGGEVGVESELGNGSLFYFTLPARPSSVDHAGLPLPNLGRETQPLN